MSWNVRIPTLLALALAVAPAAADEGPALRVGMQVEREVSRPTPSGDVEVTTEAVESVKRGDVLVYTLQIANPSQAPALEARVDDPIPAGTVLIPESASGPGTRVSFSVDGGKTFAPYPVTRTVVGDDGIPRERQVAPEEYTHVRWTLTEPLDPGQVRSALFKVRVE
jgi:uncharacterized repeat protein (TIGR01451 family)